jgi:thiol-disulfide isomerase/thioredoxin
MKRQFWIVLLDVLVGFAAFVLMMAAIIFSKLDNDSRAVTLATAVAFLLAGLLRSTTKAGHPLSKGLLVSAGGWLPISALYLTGAGFTDPVVCGVLIGVTVVFAMSGAQAGTWLRTRSRTRAFITVAVSLGAAIVLSGVIVPGVVATTRRTQVNRAAPSFSLSTPDGRTIHSSDLRGNVVILAFWATWCSPCLSELPKVAEASARYRTNPHVKFFAVDTGGSNETMETAVAFMAQRGWSLPCALSNQPANSALGVSGIPKLIILDQQGQMRVIHDGYDGAEPLVAILSRDIDGLLTSSK